MEHEHQELSELLQVENWEFIQFQSLGCGIYTAKSAVDDGIDYHDLENFLKAHPTCKPETALEILR